MTQAIFRVKRESIAKSQRNDLFSQLDNCQYTLGGVYATDANVQIGEGPQVRVDRGGSRQHWLENDSLVGLSCFDYRIS